MSTTSIVSWNIAHGNGICGPKQEDPDFIKIIKNHGIICLQETGSDITIPGFTSFSDLRTSKRGGGVTTLVKDSLCTQISKFKSPVDASDTISMNYIIVKIQNMINNTPMFIVNAYIPPANSRRNNSTSDSLNSFEVLHEIISKLSEDGEVILCGDLNARLGLADDLPTESNISDFVDVPEDLTSCHSFTIPPNCPVSHQRNSKDSGTNSHRSHLLQITSNCNMITLNGRTVGDSAGCYTCFKWNGNSTVDLFICSSNCLPLVRSLSIKEHTLYSDHNPVVLSLSKSLSYSSLTTPNTESPANVFDPAPTKYKITSDSLKSFKQHQADPEFQRRINDLQAQADCCSSREDIKALNDNIISLIGAAADCNFAKPKAISRSDIKPRHSAWFDRDCRVAKRHLNKSVRILNKHPDAASIKLKHRANVKSYRKVIKTKKDKFFESLNNKIKHGKVVSWKDFKKLKKFSKTDAKLDDQKLNTFQDFYQNLYSDHHSTIDHTTKSILLDEALSSAELPSQYNNDVLNDPFTFDELESAINNLKKGKASSHDMISNEIIKSLNINMRQLLLKLFNVCLSSGSYFWSSSIITPIFKKGSHSNPDNYRAIAVCSCIGKLLSGMLLNRLIIHRSINSPDPPNQCGFTKGSQCNDHILTLLTIVEKYKLVKKKVHAVFIDLRKAFDLVCRQALLFKLSNYGISGGFFKLIKDMYSSSTGSIKLNGKLSRPFKILKGTEQGHPLSPELFKVYFKELSDILNGIPTNCPSLSGITITHLAWADDVVIFALDRKSLDKQLQTIDEYCRKWGLEINITKTKYMVFNGKAASTDLPSINGSELEVVSNYTYLGITITSNGKLTQAINSLSNKGIGALFGLRKSIDRRFIDPKCHHQLFNTLINPILTYGSQIWLPLSPFIRSLVTKFTSSSSLDLSLIAKQSFEKVHLRHLKYLLGINRKASNVAAWGECGSFPLFISCFSRCIKYFQRITKLDDSSLVKAAFKEQVNSSLSWFNGIRSIINCFDKIQPSDYKHNTCPFLNALGMADICSPTHITNNIKEKFTESWKNSLSDSSKLSFYRTVKSEFQWELYLDVVKSFKDRRAASQIRSSSHKLNVETGRYSGKSRNERMCDFCSTISPGLTPSPIEDEHHFLNACPQGQHIRSSLYLQSLQRLLPDEHIDITNTHSLSNALTLSSFQPTSSSEPPQPKLTNSIIRLTCSSINRLYALVLQLKKDIKVKSKKLKPDSSSAS